MSATKIALTADGALTLHVDAAAHRLADAWIPRHRRLSPDIDASVPDPSAHARIHLTTSPTIGDEDERVPELASPMLTLTNVRAHVDGERVTLRAPSGIQGEIDLRARAAKIAMLTSASTYELQGALTLSAALLLGRIGRALINAAVVVDTTARGWLLVGDSHAGKTTTCATLIASGWHYVADDQVVLSCNAKEIVAEGWPREAHLDAGWHSKTVESRRVATNLGTLRDEAWTPSATVHGAFFPTVVANQPTHVESIPAADALTRIVRQSPWLLADSACAASMLSLLTRVASLECASLALGRDSYANGDVLLERISAGRSR